MRYLIGRPGLTGLFALAMLAGCVDAPSSPARSSASGLTVDLPSAPVESSPNVPAANDSTGPGGETAATPPLSTDGMTGGGPLTIFQLDVRDIASAKSATVETFDVGTGETKVIGSLPVTETTCCPSDVVWSADRRRVFLFGNGYLGYVELGSGEIVMRPRSIPRWGPYPSHAGDRLAWVAQVTGGSESIVVADLDGRHQRRLALPRSAWDSTFSWAPDDRSLAVSTQIPLDAAMTGVVSASVRLTEGGIDHGTSAWHLLIVPLDGSAPRDIANNADLVAADRAVPRPSLPPGLWVDSIERLFLPGRDFGSPSWSPDGRSIAFVESRCPSGWEQMEAAGELSGPTPRPNAEPSEPPCSSSLVAMDAATGERRVIGPVGIPLHPDVAWSPDGSRMLIQAEDGQGHISTLVIDAGTGTVDHELDEAPFASWSPDGAWIVYQPINTDVPLSTQRDVPGGFRRDVWVERADGSGAHLVAEHAAAGW